MSAVCVNFLRRNPSGLLSFRNCLLDNVLHTSCLQSVLNISCIFSDCGLIHYPLLGFSLKGGSTSFFICFPLRVITSCFIVVRKMTSKNALCGCLSVGHEDIRNWHYKLISHLKLKNKSGMKELFHVLH